MKDQTSEGREQHQGRAMKSRSSALNVLPQGGAEHAPLPGSPREAAQLEELRRQLEEKLAGGEGGADAERVAGRRFWRSLDELASTPEFMELAGKEFKRYLPDLAGGEINRRHFLQLAGASLALAGLTGCTRQPAERIVPYVTQPEHIVPGRPLYFATAMSLGGYATGLLVENHMGRPTKVEGNPEHPASLGATDSFAQASILELYDPDRAKAPTHLGRVTEWPAFVQAMQGSLVAQQALQGEGIRILTGTVTSPTLKAQLERLLERFPRASWHQYEPAGRNSVREGARQAFGDWVEVRYDLSAAKVIVALDADVLNEGPGHLAYARQFARSRKPETSGGEMSRLYAIESSPTPTGTAADHRLALRAGDVPGFALALAARLGVAGAAAPAELPEGAAKWVDALAADLSARRGESLVVAGETAPAELHVLAHAINDALGNLGSTVIVTDPVEARPEDQIASLRTLVEDMNAGRVDSLWILGGNPVFDAPVDLEFTEALGKVSQRVYLGLHQNETAEHCQWNVPEAHYLEGWSDARAFDGTISIVQPLIEPLYGGRTVHELLAVLLGETDRSAYQIVEDHWRQTSGAIDFNTAWRKVLHDGLMAGTALPPRGAGVQGSAVSAAVAALRQGGEGAAPVGLDLCFRLDPSIYDGRYANNGWLQELPRPLTKLTWDNALLISPATVKRLGLAGPLKRNLILPDELHGEEAEMANLINTSGKMVRLTVGEHSLEVPLWVQPGQADGTLTLHLGYGRRRAGRVGDGTGFDAYTLRTSEALWHVGGVQLEPTGKNYTLASTQMHHNIVVETKQAAKRHLVRVGSLEEYRENPDFAQDVGHADMQHLSLYPEWPYTGYKWGMTIDLSACMGCNACVVACQSENNIPVVGKPEVLMGREMHWLRIDRYFAGDLENPAIYHQPIPCMQCEKAPCEVVCPVGATVHSDEGLNDMAYNRCVGTRYCSNNCPYKVRRFNFFNYNKRFPNQEPEVALGRNPDVTVRFRGVMEKCTYCVQRINQARIDAKLDDSRPMIGNPEDPNSYRPQIQPGELKTACQAVCPSEAISFGDMNDEQADIATWKASPRNYGLIEELGTLPRTTYLARVTNPNPELELPHSETRSTHGGH